MESKAKMCALGFPASRVISLGPVRQRSTSPGRALPWLDRTQYRFGVQKRQGSFRIGRESNPDGGCHHRPVLSLGLPRPDKGILLGILKHNDIEE
ncbi:hypothetical protein Bca4012_043322 [Brassica carinata]